MVVLFDNLSHLQDRDTILEEVGGEKWKDKITFEGGDTRNIDEIRESVERNKPDFFVHFGELVGVFACNADPKKTESINYEGSKNAVDVAYENKIPFLYNSSSSVYGSQKDNSELPEDSSIPEPTDLYCKYKMKMEEYIKARVDESNGIWRAIVFRPATVCGPSPRMRIDLLPNHFTYCAVSKGVIRIAQPKSGRAVIDIEDLISGYISVINKDEWDNLIYNIGHYSWPKDEYANVIIDVVGGEIIADENVGDTRNLGIDSSRFENEFGWEAKISFEDSVKSIENWIIGNLKEIEKNNFSGILNMPLEKWLEII